MGLSLFKPNPRRLLEKRNVEGLVKAVRYTRDSHVRAGAAAALSTLGGPKAVEALLEALADTIVDVRLAAARGIEKLADPTVIDEARSTAALIAALSDSPRVSAIAARCLHKATGSQAKAALAAYKAGHCMQCGKAVEKSNWYERDGTMNLDAPGPGLGFGGFSLQGALDRANSLMRKERARCGCGAVLCVGCTPSGGGDLPVCVFCGAELNWHRLV